jgi:hypothetical protein
MTQRNPLTAQLVADLFLAIDREDPVATFGAAHALGSRIGNSAALALARGLVADRAWLRAAEVVAPAAGDVPLQVSCA